MLSLNNKLELRLDVVVETVNPQFRLLPLKQSLEKDGKGNDALLVTADSMQSAPVLQVHSAQYEIDVFDLVVDVAERSHWYNSLIIYSDCRLFGPK